MGSSQFRQRFNRALREEFMNFHKADLLNPDIFNNKIIDYLVWYNTRRVHHAFKNQFSPIQFIMLLQTNKYYKKKGYVAQDEQIVFSFSFFKQIIDYLKLLSELNLADINERRITLAEDDLPADDETKKKIKTFLLRKDGQQIIEELLNS